MTQRSVERVIGRLATDEEYRHQFLHTPAAALARAAREGLELNPCELRALAALDGRSLERFASSLDDRLQKAWLTRLDPAATGGTNEIELKCETKQGRGGNDAMAAPRNVMSESTSRATVAQRGLELLGRALFSAIFVLAGAKNLSQHAIQAAAAQGVPLASVAVPAAGILALVGGFSVLLGYRAKTGAWLLVLFLAPVTFAMHRFWAVADPQLAQLELTMFLKNLSMLGGALLVTRLGAGSWSLDARRAGRLVARTDS